MTTEEKAKAYDKALERARKIHDKILNNELLGFPDQIRKIFPELRKEEKPLTPFQQCLSCILRGVYYAEVPYKEVKEFILKVVRARTDELVELAKKHDQKEQKPEQSFEDWVDGWFKEHKEKAYPQITMDEKEFKNFCRGIRNMYQQKPANNYHEWRNIVYYVLKEWLGIGQYMDLSPFDDIVKTLQERYSLSKPVEWNQEDIKRLYSIGTQIGFLKGKYSEYQKDIDWLHALAEKMGFHKCKTGEIVTEWKKEDIDDKMLSKPKQEWSEEDEKVWEALYKHFSVLYPGDSQFRDTKLSNRQITNFLKSIHTARKPTEEEIEEMVNERATKSGTTKSEMAFYRNGIKDAIKRFMQ